MWFSLFICFHKHLCQRVSVCTDMRGMVAVDVHVCAPVCRYSQRGLCVPGCVLSPLFWSFSHPGREQNWAVACYLGRWQLTLENNPANSQTVAAPPLPWKMEAAARWHLACTVWVCYLWYTHEQKFWQSWSQLCTCKPRHSIMKAYAHLLATPLLQKHWTDSDTFQKSNLFNDIKM